MEHNTYGGGNSSNGGCGCTGNNPNGTDKALQGTEEPDNQRNMGRLLDVVMPGQSIRFGTKTVTYNPDPKVADYKDAKEVMELFLGE